MTSNLDPLQQQLLSVRQLVEKAEIERDHRLRVIGFDDDLAFQMALQDLHRRMDEAEHLPSHQRFPLSFDDLVLLEREMAQLRAGGWLEHLEGEIPSFVQNHFDALCVNGLVGNHVSSSQFRTSSRIVFDHIIPRVLGDRNLKNVGVVAPLRAALAAAETFRRLGVRNIIPYGASREHGSLRIIEWHRPPFPANAQDVNLWIVADPMGATGGTFIRAIQYLLDNGVADEQILALALFAVPEFVSALHRRFPGLKGLVIGRLGTCLNSKGYIVLRFKSMSVRHPGLPLVGDFGDLWIKGVDRDHATSYWGRTGILSPGLIDTVLEKTRRIEAALGE